MNSNPYHESIGKPLTKIIIFMRNIEFTTSLDITTITPENIGATIDQIIMSYQLSVYESPMVCSVIF